MRTRDLKTISYRKSVDSTDAHGYKSKSYSTTLNTLLGTVHPQTIAFDINDAGLTTKGDYYIFSPINIQSSLDIAQGDGIYLPDDDTDNDPIWYMVNTPFKYINHQILVVKSMVEYNVRD